MRATALPDLNAKLTPAEQSEVKRGMMIAMLNAKADWMERTMKPILPPHIYRMVWDESGTLDEIEARREKVRKYLDKADIRVEESGLCARVMKGTVQVGQAFVVRLAEK